MPCHAMPCPESALAFQFEIDFDRFLDRHCLPVFHTWLEFPLFQAGDGFLIQPVSVRLPDHPDVVRPAIGSDLKK